MSYHVADIGRACTRMISKLDYASHNIANVSTPGFKAQFLNYSMNNSEPLTNKVPSYMKSPVTDYTQGTLQKTDNPLDVALQGPGFFVLQTEAGIAYTRKGDFTLNAKNELVTKNGDYVMGKTGKIILNGTDIRIDDSGTLWIGENRVGQVQVINFTNNEALIHAGNDILKNSGEGVVQENFKPVVVNRYLERSNVNSIKEMIQLVEIQRTFESYQKLIHSMDEQDKLATERIGKV